VLAVLCMAWRRKFSD